MAFENPVQIVGYWTAAGNYSSAVAQYRLVRLTTSNTVKLTTLASHVPVGILMNLPTSGSMAEVMTFGIGKLRFGGTHTAVTMGSKVTCSTLVGFGDASTLVSLYTIGRVIDNSALAANTSGIRTVMLTHEGAGSSGAAGAA